MKKVLSIIGVIVLFSLSGCGVGTYSHSSGIEDSSYLFFSANDKYEINVVIDGQTYSTLTTKKSAYKSRRDIKNSTKYMIRVNVGQHDVKVIRTDGTVIYNHKVFISTSETKNIQL